MLANTPRLARVARWVGYLVLAVFLLMASFVLRVVTKSCSYARAEHVQLDLCAQYHRQEIDGSMCGALCDQKQLYLEQCGNNRARIGRKDVLIMSCKDCDPDRHWSKIVMKIQVIEGVWKRVTRAVFDKAPSMEHTINRTVHFVRQEIRSALGEGEFISGEQFLTGVIGSNFRQDLIHKRTAEASLTTLRTVLALAMQPEFITLLAFRKHSFIPKLYGYCGPAYFVEFTPPLTSIGYVTTFNAKSSDLLNNKFTVYPWPDRAKLALDFLGVVREMEVIGKKPLQICDCKPHNFGLNAKNTIAFLDSDDLVFDTRSKGRQCHVDKHCDINYCAGHCDKATQTCTGKRINNNLSIACKHLFLGDFELLGLLRSPPEVVREELRETLVRCMQPEVHDSSARTDVVDFAMLNRLESVIKKSLVVP